MISIKKQQETPDFVLIYPPTYARTLEVPVGGMFLARSLMDKGFSVVIINEYNISMEDFLKKIDSYLSEKNIAIGISVVSVLSIKDALIISQHIRNRLPETPLIWGGQNVTSLRKLTLTHNNTDYIVWGEGENSLPKLLKAIKNNTKKEHIAGIGYKKDNELIINRNAGYTQLNGIIELPYHLLEINKYFRKLNLGGNKWIGAIYSRGCPFKCAFCINSMSNWNNSKLRFHNLDHVLHDISVLHNEYGADGITIMDDHFLIKESRVREFCNLLLQKGINIKFRAVGRVDALITFKNSTFEMMKDAGFLSIGVGIESGSPKILNRINKQINLKQVYKVDEIFSKHKIAKHWNFITALPDETIDDVKQTLRLIANLAPTNMDSPFPFSSYQKYIPLPSTTLWEYIVCKHGMKVPETLEEWYNYSMKYNNEKNKCDLSIRPWMNEKLAEYTDEAEAMVKKLDSLYIGKDADKQKINTAIKELEMLIKREC